MAPNVFYVYKNSQGEIKQTMVQSARHTHDHIEISIILEGVARYALDDGEKILHAGDIIVFNHHTSHGVIIDKQKNLVDIHIGVDCLIGSVADIKDITEKGYVILKASKNKKALFKLCEAMNDEVTEKNVDSALMLQSYILQLFVYMAREFSLNEEETNTVSKTLSYPDKHMVVQLIMSYISENYMNDITLDMFAKNMYLSQVYISKIFKEATGYSPINYLIKVRLAKAKELLEEDDLPIKVISRKVGYEDAYHFSKLFKKYYGYPPSEAKKKAHM